MIIMNKDKYEKMLPGAFNNFFVNEFLNNNVMLGKHSCTVNDKGAKLNYPNTITDEVCPDCTCCCVDGTCDCINSKKNLNNFPDIFIKYKFNEDSYRSDQFNKKDTANNFLFTGCSFTFGTGLPLETTWGHQLNKSLGGQKFFNMGINGASHKIIIFDVYKYIQKYGKPKAIFMLLPDLSRVNFFYPINKNVEMTFINLETESTDLKTVYTKDQQYFEFFHIIRALEEYLSALQIPFIWSTWHIDTGEILNGISDQFKNFFPITYKNAKDIVENSDDLNFKNTIHKKYWERARDIQHPGIEYHVFYKNLFLLEYNKKYA